MNPRIAYVTSLQPVSGGIFWCKSCSRSIFRTINKYNYTTNPSGNVASELKTFVEQVAQSLHLAVSMLMGHVSKFITSGEANRGTFSTFVQRGSLTRNTFPAI